MNIRVISRNISIALLFSAGFMFLSVIVSMLYGFDSSFSPLLISSIFTFIVGIFPLIFVKKEKDITTKDGLAIILFSWVLSCIFGMIPYVLWGGEFTLMNAWFESVSGYTTTGSTILTNIEALPKGLLFWRSSTHFIGGLGVVVFIMLILPSYGSIKFRMSKMEVSDISRENYKYKANQLVRVVLYVYLGLTISLIFLLLFAGMPLFDAVNHAFSTVATGGFSIKNNSIAAYSSVTIEIILMVYMVLSSLHFGLIYSSVLGRNLRLFKNPVTKFYLSTIVICSLIVTANLLFSGTYDNLPTALREAFFYVISLNSSTGFAISDTTIWPLFSLLIVSYLSIQCGCSGSTSGGIKSDRVWLLLKATKSQLLKIVNPNAVVPVKFGNQIIDRDMVATTALFVVIYIFIMFICTLIYSVTGMELPDSFSASITLMGNVGPGFGTVGSMDNYSHIPLVAKFVMTLEMIIGRLGVFSALIIFTLFKRRS
ncbi:MAG: TrkH family potassium uptake protein [Bacteroidales bacterium]|nr:TrkH family potassium uptake protein [Bacteroidales bacterium]